MRLPLLCLLLTTALGADELALPPLTDQAPQPGRRASVTTPEYAGTKVHHLIALPDDWTPDWQARGKRWPVIAEYTGNYFPASGSTGEIEGAALGYGVARGKAIWIVLPYVAKDHRKNEITWWGDVDATVGYAKTNLPRICAEFGGDPKKVVLCGFSRGAIGVSFLGLHDEEVAKLWCGLWAHDHFDGEKEWKGSDWGAPLAKYRSEATVRLKRLAGRPLLVSGAREETRKFLGPIVTEGVTFMTIDMLAVFGKFPNASAKTAHTDRWPLRDCAATDSARAWFERTTAK
ncbi:MAG: hypothetical protein RL592_623 [Verrucomicrobiota bacterium]|jgi:hypothetical protein|nr:hypothetical protein [Verrucomicrobiota bacterium]